MLRDLAGLIFRNAPLKLAALAIAVVVWAYANSRVQDHAPIRAILDIRVPPEYRVVYQSEREIQVTLRGRRDIIQQQREAAAQRALSMTADLEPEDIQEKMTELKVKPAWLSLPEREFAQSRVTEIYPVSVKVCVSKVQTRKLPVEVQLSEEPHVGYAVRSRVAAPPEVMVTGPAIMLDQLTTIKTHKVSVWDAQADLRRVVPLVEQETLKLAEGVEVPVSLKADPPQVGVHIEVTGEKELRRLEGIPVQLLEPPDFPYVAEIDPEERYVSVVVSGLPQDVARVTSGSVTAYVDLRGLQQVTLRAASEPYKEKVRLLLPEDIPLTAGPPEPAQVTVVVRRRSP
jgi:YbbR domain-containing protein